MFKSVSRDRKCMNEKSLTCCDDVRYVPDSKVDEPGLGGRRIVNANWSVGDTPGTMRRQ